VSEAAKNGFLDENGELIVNKIIIFTSGTAADVANKLLSLGIKQSKLVTLQVNLDQIEKIDLYKKITDIVYEDNIVADKLLISKFYKELNNSESKVIISISKIFRYLNNPHKLGNVRQILLHKTNSAHVSQKNTLINGPEKGSIDLHSWILLEIGVDFKISSKLNILNTYPPEMDTFLKLGGCALLLHMGEEDEEI
jgi:hypothetical protein